MAKLAIAAGDVHLWKLVFDKNEDVSEFWELLSLDEQEKANTFHFDKDKNIFIKAHAKLRLILSRYIDVAPQDFRFKKNDYDKPYLDFRSPIKFNLSHSSQRGLVAISFEKEIGVDIEFVREIDDIEQLSKHSFSIKEQEQLKCIESKERNNAFFSCWVLKEAYIKAIGQGLSYGLDNFSIDFTSNSSPKLIEVNNMSQQFDDADFWLGEFDALYKAAIVLDGPIKNIQHYQE